MTSIRRPLAVRTNLPSTLLLGLLLVGHPACSSDDEPVSMSFFATSEGNKSGNFGGLAGADAFCQQLADSAGYGERTWRAYLSSSSGHARDRIGAGPWGNANEEKIADSVEALHADGLTEARILDERGNAIPSEAHDILTGSDANGRLLDAGSTCADYTSSSPDDMVQVGHTDRDGWVSVHLSPCDEDGMRGVNGEGRLYCFAE